MSAELTLGEFSARLRACSPEDLSDGCIRALHGHYRELLRWNDRVSLVGPGTLDEIVPLHYGESLAALPLLDPEAGKVLVDVGSGAGFPGFVLAAAQPSLRTYLVEARERKWSFLKAATQVTGVEASCLLGTVDRTLPPDFPTRIDWIVVRAVKLGTRAWQSLLSRLAPAGRVLVWAGREDPAVPTALEARRSVPLPGSLWKRIVELERV